MINAILFPSNVWIVPLRFRTGSPASDTVSSVCQAAAEHRANASLSSLRCSPTLEAPGPGPRAALSRHFAKLRAVAALVSPAWAQQQWALCAQRGACSNRPPTSSQPCPTHFRLSFPKPLCPPGE